MNKLDEETLELAKTIAKERLPEPNDIVIAEICPRKTDGFVFYHCLVGVPKMGSYLLLARNEKTVYAFVTCGEQANKAVDELVDTVKHNPDGGFNYRGIIALLDKYN